MLEAEHVLSESIVLNGTVEFGQVQLNHMRLNLCRIQEAP